VGQGRGVHGRQGLLHSLLRRVPCLLGTGSYSSSTGDEAIDPWGWWGARARSP
jgi:hypothetical protein